MNWRESDYYYMERALEQAERAFSRGEVPVGAVLVYRGQVLAAAHDQREKLQDVTAHAEILCIRRANYILESWRLENSRLYVTLEPCAMCASAIVQSRILHLIYGAPSPKFGAVSHLDFFNRPETLFRVHVSDGLMAEESKKLLRDFFSDKR